MNRRVYCASLAIVSACSLRDLSSFDSNYDASSSDASTDAVASDAPLVQCGDAADQIAAWPANEGAGVVLHDCVGGHDGTISDAGTTWQSDDSGISLAFDGGAVRLATFTVPPPFTVSAWLFPQRNQPSFQGDIIIEQNFTNTTTSWDLGILTLDSSFKGSFVFDVNQGGSMLPTPSAQVVITSWTHVAATFDGTNVLVYVAGALSRSAMLDAGYQPIPGAGMRIGNASGDNRPLAGALRDLRVYSRILSATEIQSLAAQ